MTIIGTPGEVTSPADPDAPAVPCIDLSPYYRSPREDPAVDAMVAEVDEALRTIGFLTIVGHPVPRAEIERVQHVGLDFFDLPQEDKDEALATTHRTRGYTPLGDHSLGYTLAAPDAAPPPPDLFERYRIGPFDLPDDEYTRAQRDGAFAPNIWPDNAFPAFASVMRGYYRRMRALARDVLRIFALSLDLEECWFDDKADREMSALVLNHFPAPTTEPAEGQLRATPHTDYGSLTIVAPTEAPGGVQVKALDGTWRDVDAEPGTFVVNIGDLMAQWTNDRWVSTLHRVVNPTAADAPRSRRLSLVYFHQPNGDAIIEPISTCVDATHPARYEPITAAEHINAKINRHFETDRTPTA